MLLFGLFLVAGLLTFAGLGLTRSLTELHAAAASTALAQAFHLAEAGVDEAGNRLLTTAQFTDPAFNGHIGNDLAQPLLSFWTLDQASATPCVLNAADAAQRQCFTIERLNTVMNPLGTIGQGANQRFGLTNEEQFVVRSYGIASSGERRGVLTYLARARGWNGAVAREQIYFDENVNGNPGSTVYPGDLTDFYGDLRTNWGAIKASGPNPGAYSRPVQVPAGVNVHGNLTVGLPMAAFVDGNGVGWLPYLAVSPPASGNPAPNVYPPSTSYRDGVWIGASATHTLDALVSFNPPPAGYSTPYNAGDTFTLPNGTVDGTITALTSAAQMIPAYQSTDPNFTPPAMDSVGNDCSNPPAFVFTPAGGNGTMLVDGGGWLCYSSYTVGSRDSVYYRYPTTIYIKGNIAGPTMLSFGEYSNVGLAADPASTPANPPYNSATNTSAAFINGGVNFRTLAAKDVHFFCLSHVYGTLVVPNAFINYHHNQGYDNARGSVEGPFLARQIYVKDGALVRIASSGLSPTAPWIHVLAWRECQQNVDDDGNGIADDAGDVCH